MITSAKDLSPWPRSLVKAAYHKVMRQLRSGPQTRPFLHEVKTKPTNSVENDYETDGYYDIYFVVVGAGVEVNFNLRLVVDGDRTHIAENVEARVLPEGRNPIEVPLIVKVP